MLHTFFDFQNLDVSGFKSPWEYARLAMDEWYFAISRASARLLIPSADRAAAARGTDDLALFIKSFGGTLVSSSKSLSSLPRRTASLAFCTDSNSNSKTEKKPRGGAGMRSYNAKRTRAMKGCTYIFSSGEVVGANAQRKVLCPEHIFVHLLWN